MNLPPLFTFQYWFNLNPPPFISIVDRGILVLMCAFLIGGIGALWIRAQKKQDKMVRKALLRGGFLGVIAGIVGLALYATAFERVPFLSMRFIWLVWFVWTGLEAWSLYRYVTVDIPAKAEVQAERDRINKWLPKKK